MARTAISAEKIQLVYDFIECPTGELMPQACKRIGISVNTFKKLKTQYVPKSKEELENQEIRTELMKMIKRGNSSAAQVLLKWKGELVERTEEVRINLTAADILDLRERARRELEADGVVQVRTVPKVLD